MKKQYDYLVVGSGLYGATFAYFARQSGKRCLVIDKRNHLGGNIYCENCGGINIHKYGAHIFHTDNSLVWQFVNRFVTFNRYTNSPIANYRGRQYNLPFNMNTFCQMWGVMTPDEAKARIEEQRAEALFAMREAGVDRPRNLEEQALSLVGRDIYEILVKGYTEKQWGRKCSDLPAFIIKRLPVRFVHDNNYFNDQFQGIPIGGYNKLIDGLLEGIETKTDADFFVNRSFWESLAEKIVFTGKIDEYYDYRFGKLDYRSLTFEHKILNTPNYQGNAVMNYTDRDVPYTRTIEHKHFEMFGSAVYNCPKTVVTWEYPVEWTEGKEPYYTVNDERNTNLYSQYQQLAQQEKDVLFGGRLAEYRYYDMAPIVEKVMKLWEVI